MRLKRLFLLLMKPVYVLVLLLLVGAVSCHTANRTNADDPADSLIRVNYSLSNVPKDTTLFAQPQPVGTLADPGLDEASGLVASRRNPGYLWTEEDSGNPNQIQLLNSDGHVVARFTLDGTTNHDWEDMAVGPGPVPNETYLYIAEIGDNDFLHPEKIIYRFPEPALSGQSLPYNGHVKVIDTIRLRLPDGPRNAEAMLLDPITKDLFILSKGENSALYRAAFPQSTTQPTTMTRQLVMPFSKVTSANVSPNGREILIRTYNQLFYYKRQPDETITGALKRSPRLLPLADEPQGEAVGWALNGSGYYTTSEQTLTTSQVIYFYRRR
jgi:hypothetical protein